MAALANASVPKISIIAGSFSGLSAYAMGGRAMDASRGVAKRTVSMGGSFSGQAQEEDEDAKRMASPVRDAWYSSARMG